MNEWNEEYPLPDWALRKAHPEELSCMQQAYTKDGSKSGNATVVDIYLHPRRKHNEEGSGLRIVCITDVGSIVGPLNINEFNELYKYGAFILQDLPTTEAMIACETYQKNRYHREINYDPSH